MTNKDAELFRSDDNMVFYSRAPGTDGYEMLIGPAPDYDVLEYSLYRTKTRLQRLLCCDKMRKFKPKVVNYRRFVAVAKALGANTESAKEGLWKQ